MIFSQVYSGVGLGLLIGFLLGLSSSPIVGLVVGSITALLSSLIGADLPGLAGDKKSEPKVSTEQLKIVGVRAGSFGLACILGIIMGIYMRTHDFLSPRDKSLQENYQELLNLGYSESESRDIIKEKYLLPKNATVADSATLIASQIKQTVLFSEKDTSLCDKIQLDKFDGLQSAYEYYQAFNLKHLASTTNSLLSSNINKEDKEQILNSILKDYCSPE